MSFVRLDYPFNIEDMIIIIHVIICRTLSIIGRLPARAQSVKQGSPNKQSCPSFTNISRKVLNSSFKY